MIHKINGRDSTVDPRNLMVDFIFFSGGFRPDTDPPPRAPYVIMFFLLPFVFSSLFLSKGDRYPRCSKGVTSVPGLCERREEGKTCNGRESSPSRREIWIWILFAVGRVRSRILKFAYGRHVKGDDEVERAFCEWRYAPARWISETRSPIAEALSSCTTVIPIERGCDFCVSTFVNRW